jgi:cbb3-type cytochrome oxidase subunit 3
LFHHLFLFFSFIVHIVFGIFFYPKVYFVGFVFEKEEKNSLDNSEGGRNSFVGLISAIEIADLGVNMFH